MVSSCLSLIPSSILDRVLWLLSLIPSSISIGSFGSSFIPSSISIGSLHIIPSSISIGSFTSFHQSIFDRVPLTIVSPSLARDRESERLAHCLFFEMASQTHQTSQDEFHFYVTNTKVQHLLVQAVQSKSLPVRSFVYNRICLLPCVI